MTALCTISGSTYRAAFACTAIKDTRYYLNGILLSAEHAELCATDGAMLYVNGLEGCNLDTDIIFEPPKLAANIKTVSLEPFDKDNILLIAATKHAVKSQHICKIIEWCYPDYKAITKHKSEPCSEIGLSVKYLARLKQVFGNEVVKFSMNGPSSAIAITCPTQKSSGVVTLMPARLV